MGRTIALAVALVACGRLGFDPIEGSAVDGSVVLSSASGTTLEAGSATDVTATIEPPGAATPGAVIDVTTSAGRLLGPDGSGETVSLAIASDGSLPTIRLETFLDMSDGATLALTTSAASTSGDTEFTIAAPTTTAVDVDGVDYDVASGFDIASPGLSPPDRAILQGNSGRLAFPSSASAFADGLYIGIRGTPPQIYRLDGASLSLFSTSPGDPDENVAQMLFADPASAIGDVLLVCSASPGGGDGMFTVDSGGTWASWRDFNNCNGLALDPGLSAGDPGFADPVYLNINSMQVARVTPDGLALTSLVDTLLFGASGIKLYVHDGSESFAGGLYMVYPGTNPPDADGFIWHVPDTTASWPAMPDVVIEPVGGPNAAAFGASGGPRYGDLLFSAVAINGEIRALRPDGTSFTLVGGLLGQTDMVLRGDELWIYEPDRGQILTVTPR